MHNYDVAVVGAGLLGCFTARNLKRYCLDVALIEKNDDVCTEISKANTAVVYAGYDNRPGSLKAELCVKGNAGFEALCTDLDVPFLRCGSLMLSYGERSDNALERKLAHGIKNGVPGLRIITSEEALKIEPELERGFVRALYAPSTGTVNPWELGIAAFENALSNGTEFYSNTLAERYSDGVLYTDSGTIGAKIIVDCSGLNAGRLGDSKYYVAPDGADYLIIDRNASHKPHLIVFRQDEEKCKGITAVPTVEGSLLLGPSHRALKGRIGSDREELEKILAEGKQLFPNLECDVIRNFSAVRPNPECLSGRDIHDFTIDDSGNMISLVGIKTPGLTCAEELGKLVAEKCAERLNALPNPSFDPVRKGIIKVHTLDFEKRKALAAENADYGEIVCMCCDITKGEIIEAIKRGAKSAEMVKHRCGTMLGHCQGARCSQKIQAILEAEGC